MIDEIRKIIVDICGDNYFWKDHTESVVKHAKNLAKQLGADEEVVEVAAWLHDISRIKAMDEGHHIYGAEEAGKVLQGLGYAADKIEAVKACILTHSSDENYPPQTLEAKIIASADALPVFDDFLSVVLLANKIHPDNPRAWLLDRYEKSWGKMMPEAKALVEEKYNAVMVLLSVQEPSTAITF